MTQSDKLLDKYLLVSKIFRSYYWFQILWSPFRQVSSADFGSLETIMKSAVKEKQPFVRLEMKIEDLLKMFDVNTSLFLTKFMLWKETLRFANVLKSLMALNHGFASFLAVYLQIGAAELIFCK